MSRWNQIVNVIRLTVIALTAISCDSRQEELINATRQTANADSIRKAVMPLFIRYHYHDSSLGETGVPMKAVPEEIKSLPLFTFLPRDEVFVLVTWPSTNSDALLFYSGGGFGHWGIAVCRREDGRLLDNVVGYTYWKDGIYFYDGH